MAEKYTAMANVELHGGRFDGLNTKMRVRCIPGEFPIVALPWKGKNYVYQTQTWHALDDVSDEAVLRMEFIQIIGKDEDVDD